MLPPARKIHWIPFSKVAGYLSGEYNKSSHWLTHARTNGPTEYICCTVVLFPPHGPPVSTILCNRPNLAKYFFVCSNPQYTISNGNQPITERYMWNSWLTTTRTYSHPRLPVLLVGKPSPFHGSNRHGGIRTEFWCLHTHAWVNEVTALAWS